MLPVYTHTPTYDNNRNSVVVYDPSNAVVFRLPVPRGLIKEIQPVFAVNVRRHRFYVCFSLLFCNVSAGAGISSLVES